MDFSIFSSFLPEGLLSHFNIVDFKELGNLQNKKDCFYIYLDEKNILPKDFDSNELAFFSWSILVFSRANPPRSPTTKVAVGSVAHVSPTLIISL